jgi:hypothetical protein
LCARPPSISTTLWSLGIKASLNNYRRRPAHQNILIYKIKRAVYTESLQIMLQGLPLIFLLCELPRGQPCNWPTRKIAQPCELMQTARGRHELFRMNSSRRMADAMVTLKTALTSSPQPHLKTWNHYSLQGEGGRNKWIDQSVKLLLTLASTVKLAGFGSRRNPCPYFCSFQEFLRVLVNDRRGVTPLLLGIRFPE